MGIGEPWEDWDRECARQERELVRYPICQICGERIQSQKCLEDDYGYICENCVEESIKPVWRIEIPALEEAFRELVEDMMIDTPIMDVA